MNWQFLDMEIQRLYFIKETWLNKIQIERLVLLMKYTKISERDCVILGVFSLGKSFGGQFGIIHPILNDSIFRDLSFNNFPESIQTFTWKEK